MRARRSHKALCGAHISLPNLWLLRPKRTRKENGIFPHISRRWQQRGGGGGIPMTGTGAIWMISIWHSSTFSHRWFRFELLVHLDLCCWFNKQTQYIVHHANCIKKLLTSFQISSFYSSVPLSFPSFPLFSPSSNPNPAFSFSPKLDPIRDQIISEVSLTGLQTGLCYRIFPEVV